MTWLYVVAFARKHALPIIIVLLALGLMWVVWGMGGASERAKTDQRTIEVQTRTSTANDHAATTRVEDAVRAEQQRTELDAATQALGDPDRERALRGCVILRQQGRDTSGIAACGGFAGRP